MSLRILIVDDEAIIRMGLRVMLEELGYRVVGEAGEGARALDLARKLAPDLVFLDIKMPGPDGLTVAETLARTHKIPVIMLTAYGDRALVDRARRAGVMGYVMKPIRESDLLPAIEVAVGRHHDLRERDDEIGTLQENLETRKLVERAKGRLMERLGVTEAEAYARLQRQSRETRRPMGDIAREILAAAVTDTPPDPPIGPQHGNAGPKRPA